MKIQASKRQVEPTGLTVYDLKIGVMYHDAHMKENQTVYMRLGVEPDDSIMICFFDKRFSCPFFPRFDNIQNMLFVECPKGTTLELTQS